MEKYKNTLSDLAGPVNPVELKKSKVDIILEIIEYVPNAVVSKISVKKSTGSITITFFDTREELAEKTSPFDTYIQVIDGVAEVISNEKKYLLRAGNGIIIPAQEPHCINGNVQFKMISTFIQSAYSD